MKIVLWPIVATVGLALAACGDHGNGVPTTSTGGGGSAGGGSSAPSGSAPSGSAPSSAPSDFTQFVNQQIGLDPGFEAATAMATSALTTDLELGTANAFASVPFGTGDPVPAATFQASVACTQAGKAACNPGASADLNSTLN